MLKSNSERVHPRLVDKATYSIRISHFHEGNDPDGAKRFKWCAEGKKPAKYVTYCRIIERASGRIVATGHAICGGRDTATRDQGHKIALGRAVRDFQLVMGHALDLAPPPPPPASMRLVVSNG